MCRGDACAGDVDVAPTSGVTSGRPHATAPPSRERLQPLQEIVDWLDPSVVLPGARASRDAVGHIPLLHRLNALRRSYARAALSYVGTCRAASGVADLLLLAETSLGHTPSAELRALQQAANALYAHVRTQEWMINPLKEVHPAYVRTVRHHASSILDLFRDPQWAERIRTFRASGDAGTAAVDALYLNLVAAVICRGLEEVRLTESEGELVEHLERSLEEEEGLFKPIVESLVAAHNVIGPSGVMVNLIVTLATRNIVSAADRAWHCRQVFDHHRSQLVDFLSLDGERLADFDHALHEGNREHAQHVLHEHFGGAGPRSIAAIVSVLDLLLKMSEMEEHDDFQHRLDVLGGVVETAHVVGEATVAVARALTGTRTALQGLGELMHAASGAVSVVTAVVTITDGLVEMSEARERGDGVALTIAGFRYSSGVLMLLALLEVPGANVAAGLIGLGVFAAETYRERSTTPTQRLFESLIEALRRPSPWNHEPLSEVTEMDELTEALEHAMTAMRWSVIDIRTSATIPTEARGAIIHAWRSVLRGLGISAEVAEEIVIDPNHLSAAVEHDMEGRSGAHHGHG